MSSHPPIRSYVLRQGHFSSAQRHACEFLLPRYGIAFTEAPIELDHVFGRTAPKILEIGSGMGETTAEIAAQHPDKDFVAIEVHAPGIGSLLNQIEKRGLTNLRIIPHDAKPVLQQMLIDASLDGIHIFFPDPWPKARHHKRRLIQPDSFLCSGWNPGGYLHRPTVWKDHPIPIAHVFNRDQRLTNTATDYAARPAYRPLTKFEQRGIKLGHIIRDLIFTRTA